MPMPKCTYAHAKCTTTKYTNAKCTNAQMHECTNANTCSVGLMRQSLTVASYEPLAASLPSSESAQTQHLSEWYSTPCCSIENTTEQKTKPPQQQTHRTNPQNTHNSKVRRIEFGFTVFLAWDTYSTTTTGCSCYKSSSVFQKLL